MADAVTPSPKTSPRRPTPTLVVTTVDLFSL